MSDSRWAMGSDRYVQRLHAKSQRAGASTPGAELARRQRQLELAGVAWDDEVPDLDRIEHVGVEHARHRFRAAIPDLIWNAAALEGNTFTLPEVRTLLDGITVDGKKVEEAQQIIALSEGYSLVDELVGAGEFRLDKETSDRIHGLVARHEAIESGHWRGEGRVAGGGSVQLSTGGHVEGVPAEALPDRWARLLEFLEDLEDDRLRPLVYNASTTRTQYYFDGNKRTARLMMTGMLMSTGHDTINVPNARRLEYNRALDILFADDDATPLLQFLSSCALPR